MPLAGDLRMSCHKVIHALDNNSTEAHGAATPTRPMSDRGLPVMPTLTNPPSTKLGELFEVVW